MPESDIIEKMQKFPQVESEDILATMQEYAELFDDMKPRFGVPLTMDEQRVHIKIMGRLKERKDKVYAGDVREHTLPARIRQGNSIEYAPKFTARFAVMDGKVGLSVILHEMTHMYQLAMQHCYIRHSRMKESVSNIIQDKFVTDFVHSHPEVLGHSGVAYLISDMSGGKGHDSLFFYKTIQLDLIFGFPPGTIFGYGVTDYLRVCEAVS